MVELGPGFLTPFLPAVEGTLDGHQPAVLTSSVRLARENRAILYPIAAGIIALMDARFGAALALYLLVLLLIANVSRRRQAAT